MEAKSISREGATGSTVTAWGNPRYGMTRNTQGQPNLKVKSGHEGHFLRNRVCPGLGGPIYIPQMRSSFGREEEQAKTCFEALMLRLHSNRCNLARSPHVTFHLSDYGLFPIYLFL